MSTAKPPSAFQSGHRRLDALLLDHQEALVTLDFPSARRALAAYRAELEVHMAVEEDIVIPAFEALGVEVRGGASHYYLAEHRKLDELLRGVEDELAALAERAPEQPREVLPLLKRELTFEHLMEHHEAREDYALYPTLEERVQGDDLAELVRRMEQREAEARVAQSPPS